MRVGLGSTNHAKIEAGEKAVNKFVDVGSVYSLEVNSPDQPINTEEARQGTIKGYSGL